MKNYKNLINILTAFMEDMWIPYEDSYSMITRYLKDKKNYIQFLLQDYLVPEKAMTKEEILALDNQVQKIHKKHGDGNGWLYF